jgi:hypothetical protein
MTTYDEDLALRRDQDRHRVAHDESRNPVDWMRGTPSERPPRGFLDRRRFVETKWAFKTTELLAFSLAAIGLVIAMWQLDNFDAQRGWGYLTALTIGYLISRGIAKAGKGTYDDA